MPKQSNKFQKLIHLLHLQLTSSRVIESAMFVDQRTGENREVDVAIISEVANYPIIISIECRDHNRPQSIGWIEEMWAKHQALPTNSLILVSSSGFYKPALEAAKRLGIETLSLEKAEEANWQSVLPKVRKFKIIEIWRTPIRCTIVPDEAWFPIGMQQTGLSQLQAFSPENIPLGTLQDIFENTINSIKLEPEKNSTKNNNVIIDIDGQAEFQHGTYVTHEGKQYLLREMLFRIHFEGFITEANPRIFTFKDNLIQVAESENKNAEIIYSILSTGDKQIKFGASVVKQKKVPEACIWDFAVPHEYMSNEAPKIKLKPLNYKNHLQFKTSGKQSPNAPKLTLNAKLIRVS